jgi:hypothetical protein
VRLAVHAKKHEESKMTHPEAQNTENLMHIEFSSKQPPFSGIISASLAQIKFGGKIFLV